MDRGVANRGEAPDLVGEAVGGGEEEVGVGPEMNLGRHIGGDALLAANLDAGNGEAGRVEEHAEEFEEKQRQPEGQDATQPGQPVG